MYFVKYGKEYLHDPRTDDCILADLTFEGVENEHSTCSFSIHPGHPLYEAVRERDHTREVVVYDDRLGEGDPYFVGQAEEVVVEFDLTKSVSCNGELAYLNDSLARPYTAKGNHEVEVNHGDYFKWLVEESHNSQVDQRKRFMVDVNQASLMGTAPMKAEGKYQTTGEVISKMLDEYGGVLRVKRLNGVRYLDYLREWEDANAQVFDFGVNLTDFMKTDDALDLKTYVIASGAKLADTEYDHDRGYRETGDASPVEGTEYFTFEDGDYSSCSELEAFEPGVTYYVYNKALDESQNLVTLEGLPDGPYDADLWKQGDVLYSRSAVEKYGWIGGSYSNADVTTREGLLDAAVLALKEKMSPQRVIEIQGVDLSLVNPEFKPIRVGEYVRVRSKPHGFDSYMLCTGVSLDLNSPDASTYTLGTTFDKLTGQQNRRINALNGTINQSYENAAALSEEAKQAAKDAAKEAAEANKTAQKAETTAGEAKDAADSVKDTADQAASDAAAAKDAAQKAEAEAIEAGKKADEATAQVELIQSDITEAKQAATDAEAKADEAKQAAADAATASGQATARVEAMESEMATVKDDAEQLREDLEGQIDSVTTTMQADYAKKTELTETTATLRTEIEQSAAGIRTEVSEDYAKKTELTSVEANLQTQIEQNASDITSTASAVTKAQADATSAQEAAVDARSAADTAQAAADAAKADLAKAEQNLEEVKSRVGVTEADIAEAQQAVDAAQKAADDAQAQADAAKAAADKAQADVDSLTTRVTTAETSIKQNADAIELRATREEVESIEVGGRNMLLGTNTAVGWTQYDSFDPDTREFVKANATKSENFIYCNNLFDLEAGQEYTLSFKAKGTNCRNDVGHDVYILPKTWATTGIAYNPKVTGLTAEYRDYVFTFTPNPNATSLAECQLRFDNEGFDVSGTEAVLYIKDVKLEKGNKATDWTPAPEDYYTRTETDAAITVESEAIKSEVQATYATQDSVTDLSTRVDQTAESITESITRKSEEIEDLQGSVDGISSELGATNKRIDEVTGYIVRTLDSEGNPVLRMFTTANELEMWLTNSKLAFSDGGVEVAYVSGQKLFISQAEITDRLDMGAYAWVPRSNGHLSLKYIG